MAATVPGRGSVGSSRRDPDHAPVDRTEHRRGPGWRSYLRALGPGVVTGASDDDPSGIATYAQAGAKFRFGFLWTAFLTFPLMAAVQEMCDRTALATGKGLGELTVKRFAKTWHVVVGVLLVALVVANALNIAADLVAIGSGMNLLHLGPTALWALIAGMSITGLVTAGSFAVVARVFKVLCMALLAYIGVLLLTHVPWGSVASHTVVPHVTRNTDYTALLVAVLGTTISPYLFFWQSAHRLEELREEPEGGDHPVALRDRDVDDARDKERASRVDVFSGMAFSNLVMFAIIVATAVTIGAHGQKDIGSAAEAARALEPVAGSFATALFALGFIGSGMLAVPVLAGSGAAGLAGLLGKEWGFSRSIRKAPVFYGLVAAGTMGGTALSVLHVNPIHLLVLVALINGLAAAPFLLIVLRIAGDPDVMGEHRNGRLAATLGWVTFALMSAAAIALVVTGGS